VITAESHKKSDVILPQATLNPDLKPLESADFIDRNAAGPRGIVSMKLIIKHDSSIYMVLKVTKSLSEYHNL
jgi:hypothetical protein